MKKVLISALVLLTVLALGCSYNNSNQEPWEIYSHASMGGVDGKPDFQEYKYQIVMTYTGKHELEAYNSIIIKSENFKGLVIEGEETETWVPSTKSVKIEGKMVLDTRGLNKQKILEMGPVITGVSIKWSAKGESFTETKTLQPSQFN